MEKLISLFGLFTLIFCCWVFSEHKKQISWKTVLTGVVLQFGLAYIVLKTSIGHSFFNKVNLAFSKVLSYTAKGSEFVFGSLANGKSLGFIFATQVLPTIIFVSAIMTILYHLGIMQKIIKAVAYLMMKVMGTSGAESLAAAANIFAGQIEAALVIKPFVSKMTRSEILALMTGGMATIAGGVLAAFVGMGIDGGHLLAASVISAPAALLCAKMLIPETGKPETANSIKMNSNSPYTNVIDAAASGATDGLKLATNIGATLIAFIALIYMIDGIVSYTASLIGYSTSMSQILGYCFSPVAWLLGIPSQDINIAGELLGKKLALNEFVAYVDLISLKEKMSERSFIIMTYALCGFSNFSSIAIQVGGIGTLAPNKKEEIAKLGLKSLLAGTIACLMTACVAGVLI